MHHLALTKDRKLSPVHDMTLLPAQKTKVKKVCQKTKVNFMGIRLGWVGQLWLLNNTNAWFRNCS
jgi:hypothetical protein